MNLTEHNGDDEFVDRLVEIDAAMAEGRTPNHSPNNDHDLTRAIACLERLESLWPRRSRTLDVTLRSLGTRIDDRPRQLGRFTIVRELGQGGGGVVFLANDPQLKRHVALKIPRPEAVFSPSMQQRFLREAEAAAQLDHRNIVPIYEAGECGGICFLITAYCPGPNLGAWLRERPKPVPVRQAALIVAALAAGVAHVHGRGVLHRDIKPSNVLLAAGDDSGELPFVPRLTDFGLAKLGATDTEARQNSANAMTRTGAVLGTPAYMAPEQAEARFDQVGPATDVYALGAVLYELLAGKPAFGGATDVATLQQVVSDEPPSLSKVRRDIPRDLETICLKCLEKAPARRYADAAALGEDLQRYLDGRPITARRTSGLERTGKRIRRQPLVAAMALVTIAAAASALAFALRPPAANSPEGDDPSTIARLAEEAERQAFVARNASYGLTVRRAWKLYESGEFGHLAECLRGCLPQPRESDLRGFEWHYLWRLAQREGIVFRGHTAPVGCASFSADGRLCATASPGDKRIIVWEWPHGRIIKEYPLELPHLYRLTLTADGARLVAFHQLSPPGSRGGRPDEVHKGVIKVWDLATGTVAAEHSFPWSVWATVSPNGRQVAGIFDPYPRNRQAELQIADVDQGVRRTLVKTNRSGMNVPAFSPDGKLIAVGVPSGVGAQALLIDVTSGTRMARLKLDDGPAERFFTPSFSPDGSRLAIGSSLGRGAIWNWSTGTVVQFHEESEIQDTVFDASGSVLVTKVVAPPSPYRIRLRDARTGTLLRDITPTAFDVNNFAMSADGQTIAFCGSDHLLHLQQLTPAPTEKLLPPPAPNGEAWTVSFSSKTQTLAAGYDNEAGQDAETLKLWDWRQAKPQVLAGHWSTVMALAYDPDGTTLATASHDTRVGLWRAADGQHLNWLTGHTKPVRAVAFSPDGRLLASAGSDMTIRLWDVAPRKLITSWIAHEKDIRGLAFSPNGRHLASASNDECVKIWEVETRLLLMTLSDDHNVSCIAYAPQGTLLATGNGRSEVKLWDSSTGRLKQILDRHTGDLRALTFSPNGRSLATGGEDKVVRIWNVVTGEELLTFPTQHFINSLAFDKEGMKLAAALHDGTVKIWDAKIPNP
jgi:WD40 repeat protein